MKQKQDSVENLHHLKSMSEKKNSSQINDLSFNHEKLEKRQVKLKLSLRKNDKTIKQNIKSMLNTKSMKQKSKKKYREKSMKPKVNFLIRSIKLPRLLQKKKSTQITNIRMQKVTLLQALKC